MPIAMVLSLVPSMFVVVALAGSGGGAATAFPLTVAFSLLAFVVIGLMRTARALETEVAEPEVATEALPASDIEVVEVDEVDDIDHDDHHAPMAA